jgi:predicted signal transduction protein with EAL and GGDEF domain
MSPGDHQFSCSLTAVAIHRVRRLAGAGGPARLLEAAGSPRTLEYLVDISHELADRLSGVAAHAVTALENGRLVDHITHQARHDVGDDVLRAVTQRLRERVRAADTVARLGGDEFAVLVEDIGDEDQLAAISNRLQEAFAAPLRAGGRTFAISASIGRAVWPIDGDGPEALLRHADAAMYAVKRAR